MSSEPGNAVARPTRVTYVGRSNCLWPLALLTFHQKQAPGVPGAPSNRNDLAIMSQPTETMTLGQWIIERSRRGISSSGDSRFHHVIKRYTPEDYDHLLSTLAENPEKNRELCASVAWLLCQRPHRRMGMWIAYGGYAKERLVASLAGLKAYETRTRKLLSLGLGELRHAIPHPALEAVARICLGSGYRPVGQAKPKKTTSAPDLPDWKTVFTRVTDSRDGLPRFYVRGSRTELFGYDGYQGTHQQLDRILEFLGGNRKHGWHGTDSPLNVALYEYVDHYSPDDREDEGLEDRIEIYAGNYLGCGNPQGAWVIGFCLFRDLLTHLGLNPPRRLKGEP